MSNNEIYSDILINNIINNEPQPPLSIVLQFINDITVKDLFIFCMELFTKLTKKRYSDENNKVNISEWTTDTIKEIDKYYNSFSLQMNIIILESTIQNYNNIIYYKNTTYDKIDITNNTKLPDLHYTLYHNLNNTYYIISFDFICNNI